MSGSKFAAIVAIKAVEAPNAERRKIIGVAADGEKTFWAWTEQKLKNGDTKSNAEWLQHIANAQVMGGYVRLTGYTTQGTDKPITFHNVTKAEPVQVEGPGFIEYDGQPGGATNSPSTGNGGLQSTGPVVAQFDNAAWARWALGIAHPQLPADKVEADDVRTWLWNRAEALIRMGRALAKHLDEDSTGGTT